MGLRHIDALDFGNIQHFQLPPARISVLGFFLDSGFLPSRVGLAPPRPPVLLDFVGIFSPHSTKIERPQSAAVNYPFDFTFFAHEAPGRCPHKGSAEILTALPVAHLHMDFGVAGLAKAHQVVPCVGSALRERNDVVYFLHRRQPTFLQALLTQWMRRSVAVTNAFPSSAVFLIHVRRTLILVVLPAGNGFMFLTVLTVRQVRTAGVGAWPLWFSWHCATSFGYKKSLRRPLPQRLCLFYFPIVMITQGGAAIHRHLLPNTADFQSGSGKFVSVAMDTEDRPRIRSISSHVQLSR